MLAKTWMRTIVAGVALLVSAASAQAALIAQQDFDSNYTPAAWTVDLTDAGLYAPQSAQFTTWGSAGGNVAFTNGGLSWGWNTGLTLEAGTVYTVTVAFGERADLASPGCNYNLRGSLSGSTDNFANAIYTDGSGLTVGSFIDHSLVLNTQTDPSLVGKSLWVEVDSRTQTSYDNFRVYSQAVPEPSALALLAVGLAGLFAYAWKKRK